MVDSAQFARMEVSNSNEAGQENQQNANYGTDPVHRTRMPASRIRNARRSIGMLTGVRLHGHSDIGKNFLRCTKGYISCDKGCYLLL